MNVGRRRLMSVLEQLRHYFSYDGQHGEQHINQRQHTTALHWLVGSANWIRPFILKNLSCSNLIQRSFDLKNRGLVTLESETAFCSLCWMNKSEIHHDQQQQLKHLKSWRREWLLLFSFRQRFNEERPQSSQFVGQSLQVNHVSTTDRDARDPEFWERREMI